MISGLEKEQTQHFVYMLQCNDGTYYMGYATDVKRRLREHNESNKLGAKYTRGRRPLTLVYFEECESRSEALKRENALKKLTRPAKEQLAQTFQANLG